MAPPVSRRILFVLRAAYLPESIDGANVSLHALCRRLVAAGCEPIVVCDSAPPTAAAPAKPAALPYTVLRVADPFAAMREMIAHLRPETIVLRSFGHAARAVEIAAAFERRFHVFLPGGLFTHIEAPREAGRLLRFAANSPFLVRFCELYLGCPVALVPSLLEPDEYRVTPGDAVLFVNPTGAKGVHLATALAERLPHRRFLFIRSWPDHPIFPLVPVHLPNVEWSESTHDMRPIYARARLALVPSIVDESFSRVVAEAQVSGIPAVASDRGGLPDAVGPGGIVLPITAPIERWCDAVDGLFADQARFAALSESAKRHAARPELAPEDVFERFLRFIES